MALKDRVRRAFNRSSPTSTRTSSTTSTASTTATTNPALSNTPTTPSSNPPALTLTRPSSRLSKITSWRSKDVKSAGPKSKYPRGGKNAEHQAMLGSFEMRFGRRGGASADGRRSVDSGVSPMASRRCSVDGRGPGALGGLAGREELDLRAVDTVKEEERT